MPFTREGTHYFEPDLTVHVSHTLYPGSTTAFPIEDGYSPDCETGCGKPASWILMGEDPWGGAHGPLGESPAPERYCAECAEVTLEYIRTRA